MSKSEIDKITKIDEITEIEKKLLNTVKNLLKMNMLKSWMIAHYIVFRIYQKGIIQVY